MRGLRILALGVLLAGAHPARAILIPDTGENGGSTDANWSVLWRPVGTSNTGSSGWLENAPLVTSIPSPPWQPNVEGNNWLGVNASATIAGESGDGSRRFEYAFTTSIQLPAAQRVTGAIGYDNFFAGAYVGGELDPSTGTYTPGQAFLTPVSLLGVGNENKAGFCRSGDGFLPSGLYPTCTVNFALDLPAGNHELTFVIQGDGVTDGFMLNQRGATAIVPEPAALAQLLLAGATILGAVLLRD